MEHFKQLQFTTVLLSDYKCAIPSHPDADDWLGDCTTWQTPIEAPTRCVLVNVDPALSWYGHVDGVPAVTAKARADDSFPMWRSCHGRMNGERAGIVFVQALDTSRLPWSDEDAPSAGTCKEIRFNINWYLADHGAVGRIDNDNPFPIRVADDDFSISVVCHVDRMTKAYLWAILLDSRRNSVTFQHWTSVRVKLDRHTMYVYSATERITTRESCYETTCKRTKQKRKTDNGFISTESPSSLSET